MGYDGTIAGWAGPQDTRPRGPAQHPGGHHAPHTHPRSARRDSAAGRHPGLRPTGPGGRFFRIARPAHGHSRQPGEPLGPGGCARRRPVFHGKMPRPVGAHPGRHGPPSVRHKRRGRGRRRPVLPGSERHARPGPGPGLCRQPAALPVHGLETRHGADQPGGPPACRRGQRHGERPHGHRHRHPLQGIVHPLGPGRGPQRRPAAFRPEGRLSLRDHRRQPQRPTAAGPPPPGRQGAAHRPRRPAGAGQHYPERR